MESKHVVFFSNYCRFCRDVMAVITKRNLRGAFVAVCVDTDRTHLPDFVDRVPLVLTSDRRVLVDDAVMQFLGPAEEASPDPVAAGDFGGAVSDRFALLVAGGGQQAEGWRPAAAGSFMSIEAAAAADNYGFPRINVPEGEAPGQPAAGGKVTALSEPVQSRRGTAAGVPGGGSELDQLRTDRDSDLRRIFGSQPGPQQVAAGAAAPPPQPY